MVWRLKKGEEPLQEKKTISEPVKSFDTEETLEDIEKQQAELEEKLKKIKTEKQDSFGDSKQEIIDVIEGSLNRIAQLVEILRRS